MMTSKKFATAPLRQDIALTGLGEIALAHIPTWKTRITQLQLLQKLVDCNLNELELHILTLQARLRAGAPDLPKDLRKRLEAHAVEMLGSISCRVMSDALDYTRYHKIETYDPMFEKQPWWKPHRQSFAAGGKLPWRRPLQ